MTTSLIETKSNLTWKFDAIHGDIDIRDATDSSTETITKLLKSPVLERLRRIKQLGFTSHSYPSADHSRYAHALGTMHMMRMLFNRLFIVQGLQPEVLRDLTDHGANVIGGVLTMVQKRDQRYGMDYYYYYGE